MRIGPLHYILIASLLGCGVSQQRTREAHAEPLPVEAGVQQDEDGAPGAPAASTSDAGAAPTPSVVDGGGPNAQPSGDPDSAPHVELRGRGLFVDGRPFSVQGVCWNPVPKGGTHPQDLDYAGHVVRDAEMMQAAGINVVRSYETILDLDVLDTLYEHGIYVMNSVYSWGGDDVANVDARVRALKDHPAMLMWVVGNEWNYNGLYHGLSHSQSVARIKAVAQRVRAVDSALPIATIYGEMVSPETLEALAEIDVWGLNIYRGLSFGDLFDAWQQRSERPMFVAEYGADAYNTALPGEDRESQALATRALTQEILDHRVSDHVDGVALGGTLFEWSDEWWKRSSGSVHDHDADASQEPGAGGPYPDGNFNEEWWGIVTIERSPRPAYDALKALYTRP